MSTPGGEATLARLLTYPVKSLDGQEVAAARVLDNGALEHDRRWALFDSEGVIVNAKRYAVLQSLRSHVDCERGILALRSAAGDRRFDLGADRAALEDHVGRVLGTNVTIAEDRTGGFPDDPAAPGPTLIGTATLEAIAGWFGLATADMRARLRANVEIDGVPAFWEDRLFGADGETVAFKIGDVGFAGINPCLRCAVPARDPWTGAPDKTFAKRFGALRERTLPPWARRERFAPFYRVAVNTRIAEAGAGGTIRVGDPLTLGASHAR